MNTFTTGMAERLTDEVRFSVTQKTATRDATGKLAADKLHGKFVVNGYYGTMGTSSISNAFADDSVVVRYDEGGGSKTGEGTWYYSPLAIWQMNSDRYVFMAYSDSSDKKVKIVKDGWDSKFVDPNPTNEKEIQKLSMFNIENVGAKDMSSIYYAPANFISKTNYKKVVTLRFRNSASKVRVGFYNVSPKGYIVIDSFHFVKYSTQPTDVRVKEGNTTTGDKGDVTTLRDSIYVVDSPSEEEVYGSKVAFFGGVFLDTVSYTVKANGDLKYITKADMSSDNVGKDLVDPKGISQSVLFGSNLTGIKLYGNDKNDRENGAVFDSILPTTAGKEPTDAERRAQGEYTWVLPTPVQGELCLDVYFTVCVDNVGGGVDTIRKGAKGKVVIPRSCTQWEPNHAYTYFFKMSDNSFPIEFDGVVEDMIEEEIVATIDTVPINILTYRRGTDGNINYVSHVQDNLDYTTKEIDGKTFLSISQAKNVRNVEIAYLPLDSFSYATTGSVAAEIFQRELNVDKSVYFETGHTGTSGGGITPHASTNDGVAEFINKKLSNMFAYNYLATGILGTMLYGDLYSGHELVDFVSTIALNTQRDGGLFEAYAQDLLDKLQIGFVPVLDKMTLKDNELSAALTFGDPTNKTKDTIGIGVKPGLPVYFTPDKYTDVAKNDDKTPPQGFLIVRATSNTGSVTYKVIGISEPQKRFYVVPMQSSFKNKEKMLVAIVPASLNMGVESKKITSVKMRKVEDPDISTEEDALRYAKEFVIFNEGEVVGNSKEFRIFGGSAILDTFSVCGGTGWHVYKIEWGDSTFYSAINVMPRMITKNLEVAMLVDTVKTSQHYGEPYLNLLGQVEVTKARDRNILGAVTSVEIYDPKWTIGGTTINEETLQKDGFAQIASAEQNKGTVEYFEAQSVYMVVSKKSLMEFDLSLYGSVEKEVSCVEKDNTVSWSTAYKGKLFDKLDSMWFVVEGYDYNLLPFRIVKKYTFELPDAFLVEADNQSTSVDDDNTGEVLSYNNSIELSAYTKIIKKVKKVTLSYYEKTVDGWNQLKTSESNVLKDDMFNLSVTELPNKQGKAGDFKVVLSMEMDNRSNYEAEITTSSTGALFSQPTFLVRKR